MVAPVAGFDAGFIRVNADTRNAIGCVYDVRGKEAPELDTRDPVFIASGVDRADVIVAEVFKVGSFYLWLDGWHYRGILHVNDVADGDHDKPPNPVSMGGEVRKQLPDLRSDKPISMASREFGY